MAKLPNGILGGFIGTLGPAVGTQWKGNQVIRSRPPRKRPRSSEDQLKQQAKMSLLTPFIGPVDSFSKQYISECHCSDVVLQPSNVI